MKINIKKISVSLATVLLSGLAWYFFSQIFNRQEVILGQGFNWTMFGICIAAAYGFMFFVALARDKIDFFLTSLLSVLWILVFMGVDSKSLISAGALFVASATIQEFPKALERSLNLQYYFTAYAKIALVIIALLGVTSAYFQSYVATNIERPQVSQKTSDFIWPFVSKYVSQFESDQTVDQYLRQQLIEQGVNNPPQSVIAGERQAFSQQLGIPLRGNEKMSDIGREFLGMRINEFTRSFHLQQSGIYVIFFSILILWPVMRMLFALVAVSIYYIFKSTGLVHVTEEQITTKSLTLG